MKPIIKLYLKIFLLTAITYFIFKTLSSLADDSELIKWKNITTSLFFGIFMSIILVSSQWNKLKKAGVKNITDNNIGVNQIRTIESKLNKNELIHKLKLDPTIGKMNIMEIENGFLFKTGMSMKSYGEEIKIILISNKDSNFEYQVSSSPKLKTTIIDYGKNLENINKIQSVIKRIA